MRSVDRASYVKFSATLEYRDMHEVLMGLINKTDRDPYHGPKLRRSLEGWAHNRRHVSL
jgi:hypothetical protein